MRIYSYGFIAKGLVIVGMVLLGLTLGSPSWAKDKSTKVLANQVVSFGKTGNIYETAAVEDLTAMLEDVQSSIADGDKMEAKGLLAAFARTVHEWGGKIISPEAASSMIDAANALSASL